MNKQEQYEAFLPQLQGLIDETQELPYRPNSAGGGQAFTSCAAND